MKLLLVEDDPELDSQMVGWMAEAGHELHWEERGKPALEWLKYHACDAAMLDLGLPDLDGFALVELLRGHGVLTPVLFLTARASVADRVRGLEAGGDDYLTETFCRRGTAGTRGRPHRRATHTQPTQRKVGNCRLDPVKRRITCGTQTVELQPREWTLLEVLMNHAGRIMPKQYLLEQVWDIHFDPGTNVVDAMVCRLRRKLEMPDCDIHIETIRGKGYVFKNLA